MHFYLFYNDFYEKNITHFNWLLYSVLRWIKWFVTPYFSCKVIKNSIFYVVNQKCNDAFSALLSVYRVAFSSDCL